MKEAGRIHCPAPLPEEPVGPILTKMLVPAPYTPPKKKAEKEANKTRGGLCRRGTSDTMSEGSNARSASEEDEEEEEEEEDPAAMRLGSHMPPLWRGTEAGAGAARYSSSGSLPPSRCSRT